MSQALNNSTRPQQKRQRKRSRYPYTRKEKTIVALVCVQLTFSIWALALTQLWSQWVFTLLSFAGLTFALLPQFYTNPSLRDPRLESNPSCQRLLRYPVFWSGLLLIIYMLVQSCNPAFGYEETTGYWRSFPITHIEWLPSGISSPFSKMNAQRLTLMIGGAWMMQCYLKVGIVRRNSFITILWVVVANFILLGILTIAQKQTHAPGIFWTLEVMPNFIGSIPYNNRAAAILMMGMVLAMALYFLHLKAMRMELRHSGPHLVVLLVIVFIFGLLWSTQSQGGVILSSLLLGIFLLLTLIPSLRDGSTLVHKTILFFSMVLLGVSAVFYTLRIPDRDLTIEQLGNLREDIQNIDSSARTLSTRITMQMVEERPLFGWGAGSWRYVFAYFQLHHPEIQYLDASRTVPAVWEDAHNDWAQYLSELGIIGSLLLGFMLLWPLMESLTFIRSIHLTQVILCLGVIALLLFSLIDLLLQNQAVLSYLAFMSFLVNRLNIEQMRAK